ncbi:codeine O-demethylase-like [Prosopis cineraria]|uniref:codeine O-demethylase-like n=1 Tax=Prosopis cineraria TaxID=364024 RepID=UPI00240EBD8E|nr:codeine O-demethylase-like [Prosopis cineraria]
MSGSVVGQSVQELFLGSEELPEQYIYKDGEVGALVLPLQQIPIIDIALLLSPSLQQHQQGLNNLRSALTTWGCFQAINHGMTSWFLGKVREVSKQFFELPKEEKQKYERQEGDHEGYGSDIIFTEDQRLDWTDRVYLKVQPEHQRKFKVWPQLPHDFRDVLIDYTEKVKQLNEVILKAMAKSLNLEENSFLKQCGETNMFARFNYYPPCKRPEFVLGLKPHADGSAITFLLQHHEVEGLQILRDNNWFKVPIIPEALLVNVGDQIEIMSNGIFKSPVHRAVINSDKERLTLAMFCAPDVEAEIEPVKELIDESRPKLYKSIKNYVQTYFQYYQKNRRAIDAVKIKT